MPRYKRRFYLDRGRAIHEATALYDSGELEEASIDPRISGFLTAWKNWRRDTGAIPRSIEYEVESASTGYRGRFDRLMEKCTQAMPGGLLLLDIKTNEYAEATRLQTMAYLLAYRELTGSKARIKRGVVALHPDGRYTAEVFDDDAGDEIAWRACVVLASWKQRKGLTV